MAPMEVAVASANRALSHLGVEAGLGLHGLLVLIREDAGAAAGADEGADGVKGIRDAEGEDGNQHQGDLGGIGEQGGAGRRW